MRWHGSFLLPLLSVAAASCGLFNHKKTAEKTVSDTASLRDLYYAAEMQFLGGNFKTADSMFSRYVKAGYRTAPGYYRLASIAHNRGDQQASLAYLKKGIAADSSIREFRMLESDVQFALRNYAAAADALFALTRSTPRAWTLYVDAARYYQYSANYERMLTVCDKWESTFGLLEPIAENKSTAYRGLNKFDEAAAEWERLSRKYPDRRQYRTKLADVLVQAGQTDRAERVLDSLLRDNPEDAQVLSRLCRSFSADNAARYKRAMQLAKVTQASWNDKSQCLSPLLQPDHAYYDSLEPLLTLLVQAHPTEFQARTALAEWLYEHGKTGAAAEQYQKCTELTGTDMITRRKYLTALSESCDLLRFRAEADTLTELYPNNAMAAAFRGKAALYTGDYQNGVSNLEESLLFIPDEISKRPLKIMMARIWIRQGKAGEALTTLNDMLQQAGRDPDILEALAEAYSATGQHEQAMKYADEAVKQAPRKHSMLLTRTAVQTAAGKAETGSDSLMRIMPESPFALELAGDAMKAAGQCQRALEYWNRAAACQGFGRAREINNKIKDCQK